VSNIPVLICDKKIIKCRYCKDNPYKISASLSVKNFPFGLFNARVVVGAKSPCSEFANGEYSVTFGKSDSIGAKT